MMPGMPKELKDAKIGDDQLKPVEAIIHSMTPLERRKPELINGSRRTRIANGSGTTVGDVNRLVKQFGEMQKMMKRMGGAMGRARRASGKMAAGRRPARRDARGLGMPGLPGGLGGMPGSVPGRRWLPGVQLIAYAVSISTTFHRREH